MNLEGRVFPHLEKRHSPWVIVVSLVLSTLACQGSVCLNRDKELPTTVPELAALVHEELNTPNACPPVDAIEALGDMGSEAAPAVPTMIPALYHDDLYTVSATACAFSRIGPGAAPAVPALIELVRAEPRSDNLEGWYPYWEAIIALGNVGEAARPAVPVLADALAGIGGTYAAWALAQITLQDWPDADLEILCYANVPVFSVDEDGIPLVVTAAREWWQSNGKHQEWPAIGSE
jgi:hypothetical protein